MESDVCANCGHGLASGQHRVVRRVVGFKCLRCQGGALGEAVVCIIYGQRVAVRCWAGHPTVDVPHVDRRQVAQARVPSAASAEDAGSNAAPSDLRRPVSERAQRLKLQVEALRQDVLSAVQDGDEARAERVSAPLADSVRELFELVDRE
ncbi:MAG: hypothetical protein ACHREM_16050 [Polyangiales bacterium]